MKGHISLTLLAALLLLCAIVASAQTQHITPFTGTWALNLAKSKFNPGPPFKSFTLTFAPDGVRHLDLVQADGQPLKASLPWSDGKQVQVNVTERAMQNVTAVSRITGNTFDDTWRQNGSVIEEVHGEVSSDRKTLTIIVEGPASQGGTFHNRVVFDKQ